MDLDILIMCPNIFLFDLNIKNFRRLLNNVQNFIRLLDRIFQVVKRIYLSSSSQAFPSCYRFMERRILD
jgi:GTP cyclohydrolase II